MYWHVMPTLYHTHNWNMRTCAIRSTHTCRKSGTFSWRWQRLLLSDRLSGCNTSNTRRFCKGCAGQHALEKVARFVQHIFMSKARWLTSAPPHRPLTFCYFTFPFFAVSFPFESTSSFFNLSTNPSFIPPLVLLLLRYPFTSFPYVLTLISFLHSFPFKLLRKQICIVQQKRKNPSFWT